MYLKKLRNKYKACKGDEPLTKHYLKVYKSHFKKIRLNPLEILEIGVQNGGSLRMWRDYFPNSNITGIDINNGCKKHGGERIKILIGDQADADFLSTLGKFDIIIDDGGHTMVQQHTSYQVLWNHLNKGGIYVIEDLSTSYWPKFGGEYGEDNTMIGYLKDDIDSINYMAINHKRANKSPMTKVKNVGIKAIHFYPLICLLYKGGIYEI